MLRNLKKLINIPEEYIQTLLELFNQLPEEEQENFRVHALNRDDKMSKDERLQFRQSYSQNKHTYIESAPFYPAAIKRQNEEAIKSFNAHLFNEFNYHLLGMKRCLNTEKLKSRDCLISVIAS